MPWFHGGSVVVNIEVDSFENIDGQDVMRGLYYLADLKTNWMACRATKASAWGVFLTTDEDATRSDRLERQLIEDVDPVQVKESILHTVRRFSRRAHP